MPKISTEKRYDVLYFLDYDFYKETKMKLVHMIEEAMRDVQNKTLIRFRKVRYRKYSNKPPSCC